jgi:hypothetical protein
LVAGCGRLAAAAEAFPFSSRQKKRTSCASCHFFQTFDPAGGRDTLGRSSRTTRLSVARRAGLSSQEGGEAASGRSSPAVGARGRFGALPLCAPLSFGQKNKKNTHALPTQKTPHTANSPATMFYSSDLLGKRSPLGAVW